MIRNSAPWPAAATNLMFPFQPQQLPGGPAPTTMLAPTYHHQNPNYDYNNHNHIHHQRTVSASLPFRQPVAPAAAELPAAFHQSTRLNANATNNRPLQHHHHHQEQLQRHPQFTMSSPTAVPYLQQSEEELARLQKLSNEYEPEVAVSLNFV
jgi:hypothetical protein